MIDNPKLKQLQNKHEKDFIKFRKSLDPKKIVKKVTKKDEPK